MLFLQGLQFPSRICPLSCQNLTVLMARKSFSIISLVGNPYIFQAYPIFLGPLVMTGIFEVLRIKWPHHYICMGFQSGDFCYCKCFNMNVITIFRTATSTMDFYLVWSKFSNPKNNAHALFSCCICKFMSTQAIWILSCLSKERNLKHFFKNPCKASTLFFYLFSKFCQFQLFWVILDF